MITSLIVLETELNADISMQGVGVGGRKQLRRVWTMDKRKKGKMRTTISERNGGDASRQNHAGRKDFCQTTSTKTQRQHKDASPESKEKQNSTAG